ncbi:hypothetical protein HCN44_001622 [Aphidius gifuensis]|uniref:MD-2-related lipid-recognition domain-containing protein n=1 Tax=Aphidius gifuensis TaxID=684658 RepID=A0A835CQI4_APHGI|nr:NPC intracellular cholesterol transporter 2-like [Aphidius gifuensis]KAF7992297.1 hypothetical protein HCN44_001622 [Aphidius gifuensis]
MRRIVFICLSLLIFGSVTNARFWDCSENGVGAWSKVSVKGCDNDEYPCEMKMGQNLHISITFTTNASINNACAKVEVDVLGKKTFMLKEDICENENSGVKCPLNQGLQFTYKGSAKVPEDDQLQQIGEANVYWRLVKDDKESKENKRREAETPTTTEIVCVKIPITIVYPEVGFGKFGEYDDDDEDEK